MLYSLVAIVRGKESYFLPDTIVPTQKVNIFSRRLNKILLYVWFFLINSYTVDAPSWMVHWIEKSMNLLQKIVNC